MCCEGRVCPIRPYDPDQPHMDPLARPYLNSSQGTYLIFSPGGDFRFVL